MKSKFLPPGDGRRLSVIGDNVLVRLAGADTGGAFALVEQTNPPGVGIPPHVHANEDELFEVLEGGMTFTVGGETFEAGPGAAVFLPRNVPHSFTATGPGVTRTHVMAFPAGIERMFEELAALPAGPPDLAKAFEICGRYGVTFLQPAGPGDDLAGV